MTQDFQEKDGAAQPSGHGLKNQGDKLQNAVDEVAGSKPPEKDAEAVEKPPGSRS